MERVADSQVTVLITGESGTGKELAARTIHRLSSRGTRDMVAVNCAALPEAVLESELFGHCQGAFTGAERDYPGLFAAAHGSTLFLDEIGEMPLAIQAKLLRVLQEREIRPIGSTVSRKIDVRILASTNRDLKAAIRAGSFREDLYFRLGEITLSMPPLRAMREDIPLLLRHFLEIYSAEFRRPMKKISSAALRAACQASWPGNVRELQNAVKRAILLGQEEILPADLELSDDRCLCTDTDLDALAKLDYRTAKESILKKFSTAYFSRLLERNQGNVSATARDCGLERQSLQQLLKRYGISAKQFRNTK
jgi:transcriptional regulator with GAF, ATPase, and Fis domain